MKLESNERLEEEVVDLSYAVQAATDDRYGHHWSNDIAVRLLNQMGLACGRKLEGITDFVRVIGEGKLSREEILAAYEIGGSGLEFSEEDLGRLMEIATEHCLTVAARGSMSAEIILDLDQTIKLSSYRAPFSLSLVREMKRYTEDDQASWVAFFSPLEAYFKIRRNEHLHCSYEEVSAMVYWCRQAVGLPANFWKKVLDIQKPPLLSGGF